MTTSHSDLLCRHAEEVAALKATIADLRKQLADTESAMSKCTQCGAKATEWPNGVPRCFDHGY
jgi:hypothetical protein